MPRINRYTTQFTVGGKTYLATFSHFHHDPPLFIAGKFNELEVIHTTNCLFNMPPGGAVAIGTAFCSKKEPGYNWRKGIKLAFTRALEAAGIIDPVDQGPFFHAFYTENRIKEYASGTRTSSSIQRERPRSLQRNFRQDGDRSPDEHR